MPGVVFIQFAFADRALSRIGATQHSQAFVQLAQRLVTLPGLGLRRGLRRLLLEEFGADIGQLLLNLYTLREFGFDLYKLCLLVGKRRALFSHAFLGIIQLLHRTFSLSPCSILRGTEALQWPEFLV